MSRHVERNVGRHLHYPLPQEVSDFGIGKPKSRKTLLPTPSWETIYIVQNRRDKKRKVLVYLTSKSSGLTLHGTPVYIEVPDQMKRLTDSYEPQNILMKSGKIIGTKRKFYHKIYKITRKHQKMTKVISSTV